MAKKRVVILGMGFGGLNAAKALAESDLEVVMVDRNNYHLFQPLLYQVATAGLEQESIAYPLRALTRDWHNARFYMGDVVSINCGERKVKFKDDELTYDYLIVATGSKTNFFGMQSVEKNSFDLKSLPQAEQLRNHILQLFEKASREKNLEKRAALLTFVVVGGGPTGVEFAGALRELSGFVLSLDYPEIDPNETKVILVEAAESLLLAMEPHLREYAAKKLGEMGVEIRFATQVIDATEEAVFFKDGSSIKTNTLFWSAGVAAAPIISTIGVDMGSGGRVVVTSQLRIEKYPEVFVVGDSASFLQDGKPLPMIAPVASQGGQYAARAIMALEGGKTIEPFVYVDKGAMATIGRSAAVATTHGYSFSGFIAWVVWLLLHLYYLIGFRNRLLVLMNWAYYYLLHERQVRLITR